GQTAERTISSFRSDPDNPEVVYLDCPLGDEEVPALYRACDCLVAPYRGEGFGLPICEAMSCGLPVIVTAYGAALDFCDEGNAYLVPARRVYFRSDEVGGQSTAGRPWLAEPDAEALA